jgi:hypothetical protein
MELYISLQKVQKDKRIKMTIHLVLGAQGSGKTLFLVKTAYDMHLLGYKIYSNIAFNFPYEPINYKDIVACKYRNAYVFIDEIHQLLPARNSLRQVNREICDGFLSMVRKAKLKIYATTQTARKVDIRFREEADYIYTCERWGFLDKSWTLVEHNQDLPEHIPIMIKITAIDIIKNRQIKSNFLGNPYFKLYDTNQIIKVDI